MKEPVEVAVPPGTVTCTGPDTDTGPVQVTVPGGTATSTGSFTVTGYPVPGDDTSDGPPVVSTGVTPNPGQGDVPAKATIPVLVVMLQTNDKAPANAATTRTDVAGTWDTVRTYYSQASYTQTKVTYDMTAFATLDGSFTDFVDTSPAVQNFRNSCPESPRSAPRQRSTRASPSRTTR